MKNLLLLSTFLLFMSGCSGKKIYEMAIDIERYQGGLELKQVSISDDLNVSYLENSVKSKKTLVLIHGFGGNKDNWLELAKKFDGKYHLIIPDLIGDGDSSKPLDINYTIENQTKMLHECLNKFADKNLVLIGNSMGGQIALNYAYHYPINSLILIDSMGFQVEKSYVGKLGNKEFEKMYFNVCSIEKMQKMVEIGFSKPPYIPDVILEHLTQEKCKVSELDRHKYRGIIDKNLNILEDMSLKSKKIQIPTLIIWGEEDRIISVQNAFAFHDKIKNSQLVILKGIGHMPMIEESKITAQHIVEFLKKGV